METPHYHFTGQRLRRLMTQHGVTIKELSQRIGIPMKRIREVRAEGTRSRNVARDWVQAITGEDPGFIF